MAEELWSDDELRTALKAYLAQQAHVAAGGAHSPTKFHRTLSEKQLPKRSEGAVGRRMSNISWILSSAGLPYFGLYSPSLTQAGNGVRKRVLAIYEELAGSFEEELFDFKVSTLVEGPPLTPPTGSQNPGSSVTSAVRFQRSAAVAAWVLQNADGVCEACQDPAPFKRKSGSPYLEIHHLHRLADGGPDTIENAIAACPNCHRQLHLGAGAERLTNQIKARLSRPLTN